MGRRSVRQVKLPLYVQHFIDRHDHARFYFRRKGWPSAALPGLPWSPEFMAAYEAAIKREPNQPVPLGAARSRPGSLSAALAAYYQASGWTHDLADSSREWRRRILEKFREEYGTRSLRDFERKHFQALLRKRTPNAQRNFVMALRGFMAFAVKAELINEDATQGVVKDKAQKGRGHLTWTEAMIAQYRERHSLGTQARLTMEIMLNLGVRVSDARRIGPPDVRDGWLVDFEPQKTRNSTGMTVTAPLAVDLVEAIAATTVIGTKTYLVHSGGRAHGSAKSLSNKVRDWCDQAGLPDCSSHGLRKACLTRLANLGLDTRTIMGLSGHTNEAEVATYVEAYNRRVAAARAVAAINTLRTKPAQTSVNPAD